MENALKLKYKKVNIYNTFRLKIHKRQRETLNDILRGTKSVLTSNKLFLDYTKKYKESTEKSVFKEPNIPQYPLLRKEIDFLISLKKNDSTFKQEPKTDFREFRKTYQNMGKPTYNFRNKLARNMSAIISYNSQGCNNLYKNKRHNILFASYFTKWNKGKIYDLDSHRIINNQYSKLNYDEKAIFHSNYKNFLNEKMEYLIKNKNFNFQNNLEIEIENKSNGNFYLKLDSIKFTFKPLRNINSNITNCKEIIFYLPLSYAFLFFYNGLDFFKNILVSSVKFKEDFTQIDIDYAQIQNYLNINFKTYKENQENTETENDLVSKKDLINLIQNKSPETMKTFVSFGSNSSVPKNYPRKLTSWVRTADKDSRRNSNEFKKNKIIEQVHSNTNIYNKKLNSNNFNNSDNVNKRIYHEYYFMWETPSVSFRVKLQMPLICFKTKSLDKDIIVYCDKNLYLYMFKKNFINWDYYCLNYLFSIKLFRNAILNSISFNNEKTNNILNQLNGDISPIKNNRKIFTQETVKINNKNNVNIYCLNLIKKIYNQLNESNESFLFFYTDKECKNCIVDFHSFHIFINYDKLNNKKKWEYFFNFIQMKSLCEISKYEPLITFLPKIIKTSFEDGSLILDFSVFSDFDAKILGYKKLPVNKAYKFLDDKNLKNEEMIIDIKQPFLCIYMYQKNATFITKKIKLKNDFIEKLELKNFFDWSQKLLEILLNIPKDSFNDSDYKNYQNFNLPNNFKQSSNNLIKQIISPINNVRTTRGKSLHIKATQRFKINYKQDK